MVGARSALFLPYPQPRPDRRRRGARAELQAGGRRPVSRPRRRGDARQVRGDAGRSSPRRPRRSRAGTWSRSAAIASSSCPTASAARGCPTSRAIDLTQDPPPRGRWLAPSLVARARGQSRGGRAVAAVPQPPRLAPLTLCRHCGHRFQCPNCTAWMVEHRLMRRLACHHCGHVMPPPQACPECGEEDSLVACGPGVERIADEVAALFPEARTAIVTSDTIWSPAKAAEFVAPDGGGRDRHRHRHPAGHQGLSFPQPDPGRRGRRRPRPVGRRPARRRAQLPADPAGRRPRRPRRQAGPGAGPDPRSRRRR